MRLMILLLSATLTLPVGSALGQPKILPLKMSVAEGDPIVVNLGSGITLNSGSTLKRQWYTINDPMAPAQIEGTAKIGVSYNPGSRSSIGQYQYSSYVEVFPGESIAAVEIRSQIFDVFGRHMTTLSSTRVVDFTMKMPFTAEWRIFSETDAASAFTSVTYLAQIRSASGRVYVIDPKALLTLVRQVSNRITEADLEPVKPKAQ